MLILVLILTTNFLLMKTKQLLINTQWQDIATQSLCELLEHFTKTFGLKRPVIDYKITIVVYCSSSVISLYCSVIVPASRAALRYM